MNLLFFVNAAEIGMIYGFVALGVYLTLRVIDFPDMTVNSSFTLGAAISAVAIINDIHPIIATLFAVVFGAMSGWLTAFINVKCKIQNLLASIIVMIGLYSINLRVMGKPNIVIMGYDVIYTVQYPFLLTFILVFLCAVIFGWILISEIGLGIRISGQNALMGNAYGVHYDKTVYIILMVSNALVAFAGSLFAQLQEFCDVSMGNGVIIIGLASVMMGEKIWPKVIGMGFIGVACISGAVAYNAFIAVALKLSGTLLKSSDIYIITAILIVIVMLSNRNKVGRVDKAQ